MVLCLTSSVVADLRGGYHSENLHIFNDCIRTVFGKGSCFIWSSPNLSERQSFLHCSCALQLQVMFGNFRSLPGTSVLSKSFHTSRRHYPCAEKVLLRILLTSEFILNLNFPWNCWKDKIQTMGEVTTKSGWFEDILLVEFNARWGSNVKLGLHLPHSVSVAVPALG